MENHENVQKGYSHYFSLILKPVEEGKSKPGEIENAWDDSWVDSLGTMRAFVGKVRNENGVDFDYDIFIADIPLDVDITTSFSGNIKEYPRPANGITIRRITEGMKADGIIRGSKAGKNIVFTAEDKNEILQMFIIKADGSQRNPIKVSNLTEDAIAVRWHPSDNWLFCISGGDVFATYVGEEKKTGKSFKLTKRKMERDQLVISHDGNLLAYDAPTLTRDSETKMVKDAGGNDYRQIFVMKLEWERLYNKL